MASVTSPARVLLTVVALFATPASAQDLADSGPMFQGAATLSRAAERDAQLIGFLREDAEGALAQMREMAAEDQPSRPYTIEVTDRDRFVSDRYVSILRSWATYTGGAHGNLHLDALTYDFAKRDFIRLDAFLPRDVDALRAMEAISKYLRDELKRRHGAAYETWKPDVVAATVPDWTVLQNFTLEPSTQAGRIGGLAFHFSPYEVGPYAMGPQTVVVPQGVFAQFLTPEARALFSGSPV